MESNSKCSRETALVLQIGSPLTPATDSQPRAVSYGTGGVDPAGTFPCSVDANVRWGIGKSASRPGNGRMRGIVLPWGASNERPDC